MSDQFKDFVNKELPVRISTSEGEVTGNLESGKVLETLGIGKSVKTTTKTQVLFDAGVQIISGRLYNADSSRNRWIGPHEAYTFSRKGSIKNGYLYCSGGVVSVGIPIERSMILLSMAVITDSDTSGTVYVRKNGDVSNLSSVSLSSASFGSKIDINVILSVGDHLQVFIDNTNLFSNPVVKLGIAYDGGAIS